MTKPVETPAVVKTFTGNPFELQAKTNALMLLGNNTVQLNGNYVLENFLHDGNERARLIEAYKSANMITLEAALGEDGRPLTQKGAPILLTEYPNVPYDPRKMGRMVVIDRNRLIIIGTHYHNSKHVLFSYGKFKQALTEYCQLAALQNRRQDPVIIPMPGLDCEYVLEPTDSGYMLRSDHVAAITNIIANTMFPEADVTLVTPA